MSVESAVNQMVKNFARAPIMVAVAAERKDAAAAAHAIPELPVPRPARRLLFTMDVDEVSLLWLVSTANCRINVFSL